MRAWGGFALALSLLLVTVPATGHHIDPAATVLLLDEVDPMPRWHSVVVAWEGTKTIEGDMILEDPDGGGLVRGGDDPMDASAVVFEFRDPDGSWRWFAALGGKACECSANDARVRILAPVELDVEHQPHLRYGGGGGRLGWSLEGTTGTYRITTYAAAEYEGIYRAPLRAEPGVTLLNHTEGGEAGFQRADDTALVSAGANALGHGMWARALAQVDINIESSGHIFDFVGLPPFQGCVCRYSGAHPDWDGSVRATSPGLVVMGPPGAYTVDVLASQNSREFPDTRIPPRILPHNYNDALAWVYADVTAAEVMDGEYPLLGNLALPPGGWFGSTTPLLQVEVIASDHGMGDAGELLVGSESYPATVIDGVLSGSISVPGTGTYTVTARARDVAGNVAERSYAVKVDVTPPDDILLSGPSWTRTREVPLSVWGHDDHSGMADRRVGEDLTSAPWQPFVEGSFPHVLTDGDGRKTVHAEFRDKAGNTATTSKSLILDTRPPIVTPVSPAPGSRNVAVLQVAGAWDDDVSATEDVAGVDKSGQIIYWFDGATGEITEVSNDPKMVVTERGFSFHPIILPGNHYVIQVHKNDRAGNSGSAFWEFWT